MPTTCLVVGCGSRGNRDDVSFYSVPSVLNHRLLPYKNELSKERRSLWIAAIKRDDLTDAILKNQRVCSKHFITGKPASLEDRDHPDWVPSQNMGHHSMVVSKRKADLDRKERADKRKTRKIEERVEIEDLSVQEEIIEQEEDSDEQQNTGVSTQTDLTMKELEVKFEQLGFAAKKLAEMEKKIENSPYGLMEDEKNEEKWKYFTGFPYIFIISVIHPIVQEYVPVSSTTALSSFNQLLLTLIKLRLDVHFKELSYHFKISRSTASRYFAVVIDIMYLKLRSFIEWPDHNYAMNIPSCFREAFHEKTTTIIDCFEVFIERPNPFLSRQATWSNYKHHNTIKFLIGITPQGLICYISESFGGRTSDKQIVENSGFCDKIEPGNVVLADRGFLIKDLLQIFNVDLVIPAFTKGKNQLDPIEVEETRNIAHVRVHVERIIGYIKNKFNIFKGTIPITMLNVHNEDENLCLLDKIITVCCALINLSPPIIPL